MTLKIKRSDLEKLSKEELLSLASHTQKLKEAAKQKSQEVYLEKAHPAQIEFHKNPARIRCFLGGNRCLHGDTLIKTDGGLLPIAEVTATTRVVSFDERQKSLELRGSCEGFAKGTGTFWKVSTPEGSLHASPNHRLLCWDGEYHEIQSIAKQGLQPVSSRGIKAFSALVFELFDGLLNEVLHDPLPTITQGSLGDCQTYPHFYGEHARPYEAFAQEASAFLIDVAQSTFYRLCVSDSLTLDTRQSDSLCPDIYSVLSLETFSHAVADRIVSLASEYILSKSLSSQLSLEPCELRHKVASRWLSGLDASRAAFDSTTTFEPDSGHGTYWDISVSSWENYECALGLIHHNSGKSTAGVNELIWNCLGTHPFKRCRTPIKSAVILSDYENHCKNIFEPKLTEWAPPNSYKVERNQSGAIRRIMWNNGSVTDVYSHDQDKKVFEGSDYSFALFDEPPPAWLFKSVWRGLTDHGGYAVITATPLMDPWLYNEYKRFKAGEQTLYWFRFVSSYENAKNIGDGNEALGKTRLDQFADLLDPEERAARLGGEFMQAQGMVFSGWDRSVHLIKPFKWPHDWPIIESIDPHPRKPAGVSWVGLAPNGAKILISSGYLEGDVIELGDEILRRREMLDIKDDRKPRITRCLIDNASNAPLTGKSLMNMSRERVSYREELEGVIGPKGAGGPRIECPPKDVAGKIAALRAWLTVRERDERQRPDFFVFDTPENEDFIAEIEGYVWARFKSRDRGDYKDQPIKKNDDILDSVLQVALTLKAHDEKEAEVGRIFKTGNTYSGRPHSRRD